MCVRTSQLGTLLLGFGAGLLVSVLLQGWFLRLSLAAAAIILGSVLNER